MCHEGTCTQCSQILPLYFLLLLCMTKIFEKKFHLISIWSHGGWKLWLKLFSFLLFFCIFQYLRYFIQGSLLLYSIAPSHLPFHHHLELFFLSDNQTSTIHLPTHIPLLMVHSHDTSSSMIFFIATVIISDYFSYVSRILHPLSPTRCISLFLIWNFIR